MVKKLVVKTKWNLELLKCKKALLAKVNLLNPSKNPLFSFKLLVQRYCQS